MNKTRKASQIYLRNIYMKLIPSCRIVEWSLFVVVFVLYFLFLAVHTVEKIPTLNIKNTVHHIDNSPLR